MSGVGSSDGYGATCGTFLTLYKTVSLSCGLFYPFHGFLDLVFKNVTVGEAIPLLIALNSLLNHKPIVTISQINEEMVNFLDKFKSYED